MPAGPSSPLTSVKTRTRQSRSVAFFPAGHPIENQQASDFQSSGRRKTGQDLSPLGAIPVSAGTQSRLSVAGIVWGGRPQNSDMTPTGSAGAGSLPALAVLIPDVISGGILSKVNLGSWPITTLNARPPEHRVRLRAYFPARSPPIHASPATGAADLPPWPPLAIRPAAPSTCATGTSSPGFSSILLRLTQGPNASPPDERSEHDALDSRHYSARALRGDSLLTIKRESAAAIANHG